MKKDKIITMLRRMDAEKIAGDWPFPDKAAGERIYAKCRRSADLSEPAEEIRTEAAPAPRIGMARVAAAAAAVLVVGGGVGTAVLLQQMRRSEPLPTAEEQSAAESTGSEPDSQVAPVIVPGRKEDPVESVLEPDESTWERETFSQEASQAETDSATSAAESEAAVTSATDAAKPTENVKPTEHVKPTEAVRETTAPTEASKPSERITLAEAVRICSESAGVYEAVQTIKARYVPDYCPITVEMEDFYLDEKGNESVTIYNSDTSEPYTLIYYTNRNGERWVLASTEHERPTSACRCLTQKQTEESLRWLTDELGKSGSALTEEQKSQLRALEQEERELWTTTYIRRRLEIGGMLSPDAPRLTYAMTEHLCAACETPEQAMGIILNSYVPDYLWGSGMTYYNYVLNADTNEAISLVGGSGIYYWSNFEKPEIRRDFFQ